MSIERENKTKSMRLSLKIIMVLLLGSACSLFAGTSGVFTYQVDGSEIYITDCHPFIEVEPL